MWPDGARVLYLVHTEGLSAVFQSMVVEPLARLHSRGFDTHLVVFAPVGQLLRMPTRMEWATNRQIVARRYGGRFTVLPAAPTRFSGTRINESIGRLWLSRHPWRGQPLVVHCRGPYASRLAVALRRRYPALRVLFDMRGLTFAEHLLVRDQADPTEIPAGLDASSRKLFDEERAAAQEADAVMCVSRSMASCVRRYFGTEPSKLRIVQNPAKTEAYESVAERRRAVRQRYGLEHRYVICYSGSLREWQRWEEAIRLFVMLRARLTGAYFLGVSDTPDKLQRGLVAAGVSSRDSMVLRVPHDEVPDYMAASDLGLIMRGFGRGPRLADRVSAPVKFAEYLSGGTPVVIAEGIGDASELTDREGLGVVVPGKAVDHGVRAIHDFATAYQTDTGSVRSRCHAVACAKLGIAQHAESLAAVYVQLLSAHEDNILTARGSGHTVVAKGAACS